MATTPTPTLAELEAELRVRAEHGFAPLASHIADLIAVMREGSTPIVVGPPLEFTSSPGDFSGVEDDEYTSVRVADIEADGDTMRTLRRQLHDMTKERDRLRGRRLHVAFVEGHAVITISDRTIMTNPAVTNTESLAANLRAALEITT